MSTMRIWEKRTKTMLKPLQFKKVSASRRGDSRDRENTAAAILTQIDHHHSEISRKDEQLIKNALKSIIERREEKVSNTAQSRESIFERVEKTKEIHLIRLTTQKVKSEIESCREKASRQARAVAECEKTVQEDYTKFLESFHQKKSEVAKQGDSIRDLIRVKNELIANIKDKNSELQGLTADNRKSVELIEGLRELQKFIDKLMPPADREKKEQEM